MPSFPATPPALVLLSLLSAACSSVSMDIVRQADPAPYSKETAFVVHPIEYDDLQIDDQPEAVYIANSNEETKGEKWQQIKANVQERFAAELAANLADEGVTLAGAQAAGVFQVSPVVHSVESGYYRIPAWNAVTRIYMSVRILDSNGTLIDEINVSDGCGYDLLAHPTINQRMLVVASSLAESVAEYLAERMAG